MAGRPRYEPTESDRETVRSMAACGFTHEAIARCLGEEGIDPKTLRLHFRNELDTAVPKANAAVGNRLYQAAMAGEAWAVCFWLKARAGWSERQIVEHAGLNASTSQIRDAVLAALQEFPDARQEVARKLIALESSSVHGHVQ